MELSFEKILVMVLCGGKGERLHPLTRDRAKPSVPFLGSYRIIDFSLSNALNSGLRKIALLTQYKSLSLERHILNGWHIFNPERGEYIISLPAQGRISNSWYEGTADAVFQNIYTIQQEKPDYVLILSGDHIYRADYRELIRFCLKTGADGVVMTTTVPLSEASRLGNIAVNGNFRIIEFEEKPKKPFSLPWDSEKSLVSMGIYLFKTPILIRSLIKDARNPKSSHDFGKDIFSWLIKQINISAYIFDDYWQDIGTIDAYWQANIDFLSEPKPLDLSDKTWPLRTHRLQYAPSFITDSEIKQSIISEGCKIKGARIEHSILSPGVQVGEGCSIKDAIIFEGSVLEPGVRLNKVIIDKWCHMPKKFEVGFNADEDSQYFKISRSGVRVIPKNWKLK